MSHNQRLFDSMGNMQNPSKAKVTTDQLQIGMYVCELDRPWLETRFLMQGFYINSEEEINELAETCLYVYIDTVQSRTGYDARFSQHKSKQHDERIKKIFPDKALTPYKDLSHWENELSVAKPVISKLCDSVAKMMDDLKVGRSIDVRKIEAAVDPMIDSLIRNPDACIWLARMKNADSYAYRHATSASIWAVALGRQLGLPVEDLKDLAIGTLLFDIGKLRIPKAVLEKTTALSPDEFIEVKKHVQHTLDMLDESNITSTLTRDIAAHHHERYNGRGYPQGLKGEEIPVFARIAAIVDCYDAITSERPYRKPVSPSEAIRKLYEWGNIDFQKELVEEFIQAIGLYPAGTMVELSTGQVGVVVSEYRSRRLRPNLLLVLDENKQPLQELQSINLMETTHDYLGRHLEIVRSLEPGAYGIDQEIIY